MTSHSTPPGISAPEFVAAAGAAMTVRGWLPGWTPGALLLDWESMVAVCGNGYMSSFDEYRDEIATRDMLEVIVSAPELAGYPQLPELRRNLERIDARFRELLNWEVELPPEDAPWWRRHPLKRAGTELARDLWERYRVGIAIVGPKKRPMDGDI